MAQARRNLLGEFVQKEIEQRNMSVNEFGEKSGIAHTIIFRMLRGSAMPTLGTLSKLARFTKTDIGVLARMCVPEASYDTMPDVQIIAEEINQLPPVYREAMVAMIRGLLAQQQRGENR